MMISSVGRAVTMVTALLLAGTSAFAAGTDIGVPLPAPIQAKGKLVVGTYCDYPPFGFTGADQTPQGFDPDVAHDLAELAFGDASAVEFQCVKSDQRISFLQSGRIDVLISTLGVTLDRAKVVDFSKPYFASTTVFLARKGEEFAGFNDIKGEPLAVSSGTPWISWLERCQPGINLVQYDSIPNQIEALGAKRIRAILADSTLGYPVAEKNKNFVVTGPSVNEQGYQWAFGARKGDTEFVNWLNAAIDVMQKNDQFWGDLTPWISDEDTLAQLKAVVRRPDNNPDYSTFQASVVAEPACPK